jgi:mannose-6-phosphate isomerase-like protein (cupin superfamily)
VLKKSLRFGKGFRVVRGNRASQAAEMVLAPGDTEGGADNRHRGADQWLFVLWGQGEAHQVRNTGRTLLRTLNFYVPPAHRQDGDPLPRGRK